MSIVYKIYTYLVATPLFILVSAVSGSITALAGMLGDRRYVAHYAPVFWCWFACRIYLLPVTVKGRENLEKGQTYVFMPNHQGYFDVFLFYAFIGHKFKWMMKDYLRNIPFIGYASFRSGHVHVGDTVSSIARAVRQSRELLAEGMSMCIFPEGTRSHTGEMGEFKRGAFVLANQLERPIVPVTINGSFNVFNRYDTMVNYHPLELIIHKPIPYDDVKGKNTKVVMKEVFDIIHSELRLDEREDMDNK